MQALDETADDAQTAAKQAQNELDRLVMLVNAKNRAYADADTAEVRANMLKYFTDQADQAQRDADSAAAKLADAQKALEDAQDEYDAAVAAKKVIDAQASLDQSEQTVAQTSQDKANAEQALEDARAEAGDLVDAGLADMPTPVAEDMGLASTGVDMEVAAGLMAIMAVVGAGCILVRRRID